jgi:spore germination cell wall hydrolase CwlJ-like protein
LLEKARERARAFPVASACALIAAGTVGAALLEGGAAADRAPPTLSAAAQHQRPAMVNAPVGSTPAAGPALLQSAVLRSPARLRGSIAAPSEAECLTAAVYYEARGEAPAGQAAVAQVVLNRVHRPGFPKTVCGVVYQGAGGGACQFSFACGGASHARHEGEAWSAARHVAARALSGYVMTAVGRATHFHVTRLGPVWGDGFVKVAEVGDHSFYMASGRHRPTLQLAHTAPTSPDAGPDAQEPASAPANAPTQAAVAADPAKPVETAAAS